MYMVYLHNVKMFDKVQNVVVRDFNILNLILASLRRQLFHLVVVQSVQI